MKANIYSLTGEVVKQIDLPKVFRDSIREDLISRAVISEQTREYQPKGSYKYAGVETSADYQGRKDSYRAIKNKGISRLPREKLPQGRFGRVRIVPFAVKGRRAHPPKPEKVLIEKINKKEYKKAVNSAIAATANKDTVVQRGHKVEKVKEFPIIISSDFEKLKKTKDVISALTALGLDDDLKRGKNSKKLSGVALRRRGGYRRPKSILVITGEKVDALKSTRNISGVDVTQIDKVTASLLAPGTHPGRLTVWTENAIKKLSS